MSVLLSLCFAPLSVAQQQPTDLHYTIPGPPVGMSPARLGSSVAVGNGMIVAGAPYDSVGANNSGSAKVFHASTGALLHTIPNPAPGLNEYFGYAVAVAGSWVVVAAPQDEGSSGRVFVYNVAGSTPTVPVLTLTKPNPVAGDYFGNSISISGSMLVVGSPYEDTGANAAGAAFVYDLNSPTPGTPVRTLLNPVPESGDVFGSAVAISGTWVVVGSPGNDVISEGAGSAYVFDLTNVVPVRTLNNPAHAPFDSFGNAVAISGTRVMVGAAGDDAGASNAGSMYFYDMAGGNPTAPVATYNNPAAAADDQFGSAVSITGVTVAVSVLGEDTGATNAGGVYLYTIGGGAPAFLNTNPTENQAFGSAVAINDAASQVVIGAPQEQAASGTVYAFNIPGAVPALTLRSPSPSANDKFGLALAMSGNRVVAGAPFEREAGIVAGSAHVYDLAGGSPTTPVLNLLNPDPAGIDLFGQAVAISDTRVVVGAPSDDTGANEAGSAYVYDVNSGTPTVPVHTLNHPAPAAGQFFGQAVAISGTRVAVGAPASGPAPGVVYVYDLTSPTPTVPVHTLLNPAATTGDRFGEVLAMSGSRLLVGAPRNDSEATECGRAYGYDLAGGTPTVPAFTFLNPSPNANDLFGMALSIEGTRVAIATPFDDTAGSNRGVVHVYELLNPTPEVPIDTLTGSAGEDFGWSVAISGDRILVGAPGYDSGGSSIGRALVFDLTSFLPHGTPVSILNNPSPNALDEFGRTVALIGTTAAIGTPTDDSPLVDKGSVYVFTPDFTGPTEGIMSLNPGTIYPGTMLNVSFANWTDTTPPIQYAVLVDDVIVSPAGTDVHRAFAAPYSIGPHVLKGRVSDAVGFVTEITQNFTVIDPPTNRLKREVPAPPVGVQANGQLGTSVATEGDYIVAGAPGDDLVAGNGGVVKVFHATTGALLHVITPPNPGSLTGGFGFSVAISGTRIVVGEPNNDSGAFDSGMIHVFDLASGTPTTPVASLANPSPASQDFFGYAVAISGDLVVAGAWSDDTGGADAGSAYVYSFSGGVIPTTPLHVLTNPGVAPVASDQFGAALSIWDYQLVVGAPGDDSGATNSGVVYSYTLNTATATTPVTIPNPGPFLGDAFGSALASYGSGVIVGAPSDDTGAAHAGSVYTYTVSTNSYSNGKTYNNPAPGASDNFGQSVAYGAAGRMVVGTALDDSGANDAGTAYVYQNTGPLPQPPIATLNNPGPAVGDKFGTAVAIAGTRVLVGAPYDDTGAADAGTLYSYELTSGTPTVPVLTTNHPGPSLTDVFGYSVAISGTKMVVGAPFESTGAGSAGSAYVYDLANFSAEVPTFTFNNPDPAGGDYFGYTVAISGNRVAIGAPYDDQTASDSGKAYIYSLTSQTPALPTLIIQNPTPGAQDNFGYAVAISGTRLVVGAHQDDTGATNAGSAYVYELTGTFPAIPLHTLNNPFPGSGDFYGQAVGISGGTVVAGAPYDDTGGTNAGSAYVYNVLSGTPTAVLHSLNNPGAEAEDLFGFAVAASGNRVLVGAPRDNTGGNDSGSAYVYSLESATPTVPVTTLTNPSAAANDNFGHAVAIEGTRLIVGAPQDDQGAESSGMAYTYELTAPAPTQPAGTLRNPRPGTSDNFGFAVGIAGAPYYMAVVGAPFDGTTALQKGAAYTFEQDSDQPYLGTMSLLPASPVGQGASLTVSFDGWLDDNPPLSYTVLIDDVVVSPFGSSASRMIIGPTAEGPHTLKGWITDVSGNMTEVTQNFTVIITPEDWRFQYFGTTANAGNAADLADPDGDGNHNQLEYVAGTIPIDPESRFRLRIEPVLGIPEWKRLVFSPRLSGRTYVVKSGADLQVAGFTTLTPIMTSDNGDVRTVTDVLATPKGKFYVVEITMP